MLGINRTGPFLRNSEQVGRSVSPGNMLSSSSTQGVSTILPFELRYIGVEDLPPGAPLHHKFNVHYRMQRFR